MKIISYAKQFLVLIAIILGFIFEFIIEAPFLVILVLNSRFRKKA